MVSVRREKLRFYIEKLRRGERLTLEEALEFRKLVDEMEKEGEISSKELGRLLFLAAASLGIALAQRSTRP